MRLWPFSRPLATAETDDDLPITEDQLRRTVEDLMVVHESQLRGGSIRFGGELRVSPERALGLIEQAPR